MSCGEISTTRKVSKIAESLLKIHALGKSTSSITDQNRSVRMTGALAVSLLKIHALGEGTSSITDQNTSVHTGAFAARFL